ncbi:MAG TPA: hypothetical protein EYG38_17130, partial [Verrucomicrobia bacterium]|nr:hypothetical protein [Verrucomicrobiota bacterium]
MKNNPTLYLRATVIAASVLALTTCNTLQGAEQKTRTDFKPDRMAVYKKVGEVELQMHIFEPV